MALSSSSSADLLDECMHGGYDLEGYMVEDLDAPRTHLAAPSSGGRGPSPQGQPAQHAAVGRAGCNSTAAAPVSGGQGGAGAGPDALRQSGYAIRASTGQAERAGTGSQHMQSGEDKTAHPFSVQLQLLTSKLQAAQAATNRGPRVSAGGSTAAQGSQPSSTSNVPMQLYPVMHVDSATGMVVGTGEPGSTNSDASPTPVQHTAAPHMKSQPSAFAAAAAAAIPTGLSPEQYQTLIDAGVDVTTLMSVFPAQQQVTPTQPVSQQTAQPAPAASGGLDQAEALWQQLAATGADDQTLLSVAASLGLITTDSMTGNVVLTRDLHQQAQVSALQQQLLQQPQQASYLLSVPGLYSGGTVDAQQQQQQVAAAVAAAGLHRNQNESNLSSPLPHLNQNSALASLLGSAAFASVRTAGTASGTNAVRALGSPGPGPSKQHTLYKTELCRGWLESGTCRYGSKCQFAHGPEELRPVPRHPKYKTEVCRSFTATGMCAYGNRCRFIHGSVSAPNNAIMLPDGGFAGLGGNVPANRMSEAMEGVLTLDDPSPTQRGVSMDASMGQQTGSGLSPRSRMSLALGGSARTSTGQASSASGGGGGDAAAMARNMGRLRSVPDALSLGQSNRASLESVLSCRMDYSVGGAARGRSSMGERSSLDSRAGGRASLESTQSAQEWGARAEILLTDATSPQKLSPQAGVGSAGEVYAGLAGMQQRFTMPDIPEGRVLPGLAPEDAWLRAGRYVNVTGGQTGPGATAQLAAAQLVGQLQGLHFPGTAGGSMPQHKGMGAVPRPPLTQGGGGAQASGLPASSWFTPASGAASSAVTADAAEIQKAMLLSAYSSGLYACSAPSNVQTGARRQSPSNPGLPTPERSDASMGPNSEGNLASFLGL